MFNFKNFYIIIFINFNNIYYCKNCCCCCKNKKNSNNNNDDDEKYKKSKKENDKNLQKLFNECIIKNLPELHNKYKPINSGFEWKKNWCWLISIIELYLNREDFQDFLRNTNFDENNDDDKKYIVLKNILQLLLNNEGNYNLNFDNYYEYFWYDLERTGPLESGSKYGFNNTGTFYCFIKKFEMVDISIHNPFNPIRKKVIETPVSYENTKNLNNLLLDYYKNNDLYTYILKKVLKDKFDIFLNKRKDKLVEIVNYISKGKQGYYIDPYNMFKDKGMTVWFYININYSSENVKKEIEEINKKEEKCEIININDDMKIYDIKVNSILFQALDYHFFTFVHDIYTDKWTNLNSLNKDENGKIYNPIENLNDDLEITQQGDSHKYFPIHISVTIYKKS